MPQNHRKAVLLPVKAFVQAKSRLSELLSTKERRRLMWTLFQDVSSALNGSRRADCIAIVSSEQLALQHAQKRGWLTLEEESQLSESHSVDRAALYLKERGFQTVLRLPADLPLLEADDVDRLLEASLPHSAILVPSRDGMGTNALLRNPPDAFESCFGPESLRRHLAAAKRLGVAAAVVGHDRLALDLDTPRDVLEFLRRPVQGRTLQALSQMGLESRMNRWIG